MKTVNGKYGIQISHLKKNKIYQYEKNSTAADGICRFNDLFFTNGPASQWRQSRATVSEEVGITSITIKYSRPDVNKRKENFWQQSTPMVLVSKIM